MKPLAARSRIWARQNSPPQAEPWCWLTRDMLEAPSWARLSGAAKNVVFRIAIEHMAHAGTENGNLAVTYADFAAYGIRRNSIRSAIAEAAAAGWIEVTERGRGGHSSHRYPSRYALGWLPKADGTLSAHRWRT